MRERLKSSWRADPRVGLLAPFLLSRLGVRKGLLLELKRGFEGGSMEVLPVWNSCLGAIAFWTELVWRLNSVLDPVELLVGTLT